MSTNAPPTNSHRISELDALRGLAAMVVLLFHFTAKFDEFYPRSPLLIRGLNWGEHGVALFFMLSGYVIFMTLERTKSVGEFVVGRFSRLYPAFWVSVLMTFCVVRAFGLPGQEVTGRDMVLNLTMMPRLFRVAMVDGVYWSLEFELWFYAAMVALSVLGAFRHVVKVLLLWLVVALVCHGVLEVCDPASLLARFFGKLKALTSLEYIHLFAIGMVFYDVRRTGSWKWGHYAVLLLCAVLIFWTTPVVVGAIICVLAAVLQAATTGKLPFLNARPLLWLGYISYPLYLVHQNIGYVVLRRCDALGWNPDLAVIAVTALSIGLAALLTYTVERPVMRWIRGFTRRGREVRAVPVTS